MNKSPMLSLFNCKRCNDNIQSGMLRLSDEDILCDSCYTRRDEMPFLKKNVPRISLGNKRSVDENKKHSYFNVIYETDHKQYSDCLRNRNFDRRTFNRDLYNNTINKNVIDFSTTYPNDSNKKIFSEENIDKYIRSLQYKLNSKILASCCICMNEFNKNELLLKPNCKHVFHSACMLSWLSLNSSCPMCRSDIEF